MTDPVSSGPAPACRSCAAPLTTTVVDLGLSPLSNKFVAQADQNVGEVFFPLHVFYCSNCHLVQLEEFRSPAEIFEDNYFYFSRYSTSWLSHCKAYAGAMIDRFDLSADSRVVEVASNDGYLLQYFQERGVGVLGVEPARNVAEVAIGYGVPTEVAFFGEATATALVERGLHADHMAANNVLAHVPDINDFVGGFRILLKPEGVATFEFPHLLQFMRHRQFDTVYHEHFSYLSLTAVAAILDRKGLRAFDVEEVTTHGGSLRLFVCRKEAAHTETPAVARVLAEERDGGLTEAAGYDGFQDAVVGIKGDVLEFLVRARREGKTVVGYGAAAKGNTLLNYCGVGPDHIRCIGERSEHKQGTLAPGSRIPVVSPEAMLAQNPDYIFILPWNIRDEVVRQLRDQAGWGGRFVAAIPRLDVF